jgi:hypothetical protein
MQVARCVRMSTAGRVRCEQSAAPPLKRIVIRKPPDGRVAGAESLAGHSGRRRGSVPGRDSLQEWGEWHSESNFQTIENRPIAAFAVWPMPCKYSLRRSNEGQQRCEARPARECKVCEQNGRGIDSREQLRLERKRFKEIHANAVPDFWRLAIRETISCPM